MVGPRVREGDAWARLPLTNNSRLPQHFPHDLLDFSHVQVRLSLAPGRDGEERLRCGCGSHRVGHVYRDRDRDELLADVLHTDVTLLFVQGLRHNVVFNQTSLGLLGDALLSGDSTECNFAALVVNLGLTLVHNLRPIPEMQFRWFMDNVGLRDRNLEALPPTTNNYNLKAESATIFHLTRRTW